MNKIKNFFSWFKQTKAFIPAIILIILILFTLITDKVIMPFVVDLGDERELPDVIEMTLEQATGVLEKRRF